MRLYVGAANAATVQGERWDLTGDLEYSPTDSPRSIHQPGAVRALLDSGAFSDVRRFRLRPSDPQPLSPAEALARQLTWEEKTAAKSGMDEWQAEALVSYDRLIDETWRAGRRAKRRWSLGEADRAVSETVAAARFLAGERERLRPRRLVLSCQGVDAMQYAECAREVLAVAEAGDILGLGGWCILGQCRSWLPEFFTALYQVLPAARDRGVTDVHLFGVLWRPALGGFLWLADELGMSVSTDSSKPVKDAIRGQPEKSGCRVTDWRGNVRWWQAACANLRASPYYRQPPFSAPCRQLAFDL